MILIKNEFKTVLFQKMILELLIYEESIEFIFFSCKCCVAVRFMRSIANKWYARKRSKLVL